MALVNKPDESIFASSAKQGEVDNFPDLLRGWGITFDQTQGIPPMEWFNFLFKRLDEKHTYLMQRGLPEWSATQDYTKGSFVQFDGVSYRALKNSKNNSPNESDSQYWVRWGFALSEIARATLTQYGVTQLYTGYDSQREDLALTPKTGYQLKQLIDSNTRSLGNVIPNSKKSSAVDSNSADTVATSAAVKKAYDKAESKWTAKPATETEPGILPVSHKTDGTDKNKFASEFAVGEAAKKGLPVGSIVAFPTAVTNPNGFLRANGSTFNASAFPDLYKVLGNSNTLPDLTRSDVGMTAYFAIDNIPAGWIAFDDISAQVTQQRYPELYRYLISKYGSISAVPKAADRFLRNAGNGLQIGQTQEDSFKRHTHFLPFDDGGRINELFDRDFESINFDDKLNAGVPVDEGLNDNFWASPKIGLKMATGEDETRPKSLILKLCIKAINSFDDVVFWIKSHGAVVNIGELDAGRLAQSLQDKAAFNHYHTASEITDFNESTNAVINMLFTYQKIGDFEIRKHPDGTMMITGVFKAKQENSGIEKTVLLPQSFIDDNYTIAISEGANDAMNAKYNWSFAYPKNKSTIGIKTWYANTTVRFICVGRWK
ncbi:tail fiber protein [Aggregatibacter segnis]|uniref:tail fiber protein n=1 Tax=Aggregatibacter segnis TaxID=739 RepID=UPI003F9F3044